MSPKLNFIINLYKNLYNKCTSSTKDELYENLDYLIQENGLELDTEIIEERISRLSHSNINFQDIKSLKLSYKDLQCNLEIMPKIDQLDHRIFLTTNQHTKKVKFVYLMSCSEEKFCSSISQLTKKITKDSSSPFNHFTWQHHTILRGSSKDYSISISPL